MSTPRAPGSRRRARRGFLAALALAAGAPAAGACYIDGRALSMVEDIERAQAIYAVRRTGSGSEGGAEYEVLEVLGGQSGRRAGERITAPVAPTGLLAHVPRLLLLHHETGYWDLRPGGGHLEPFVEGVLALPRAGPGDVDAWHQRAAFFLPYIDHLDRFVAEGAMDELAKAPYPAIQRLGPQIDPERMVRRLGRAWPTTQELQTTLTLLAVSGTARHADALEPLIETRREQRATDALGTLLATYLELRGASGIAQVDAWYLRDETRYYEEVEAALPAVRFHWREPSSGISAEQALALFRSVLERPSIASLVLPDLVAAQDWSSLARVVEIYRDHADEVPWIRPPVLDYLRACPLPEAKLALERIERESSWGFRRYGRGAEGSS